MEVTQTEMKLAEQVLIEAQDAAATELASLGSAFIGGGIANVIFG